jgi:hypothetical protein
MAVHQQQRRPGPGLQILQVHPVHDNPTIEIDEIALPLVDGPGRNRSRADRHEAPGVRRWHPTNRVTGVWGNVILPGEERYDPFDPAIGRRRGGDPRWGEQSDVHV